MKKQLVCEITDLPNEIFWKGVLMCDLSTIRILSRDERKKKGYKAPDVEVSSLIFNKYYTTRSQLTKSFLDTNRRPIKPSKLHTNKEYQVQAPLNPAINVGVLKPPARNMAYSINGKIQPRDRYLVFYLDQNGNMSWSKFSKISPFYFDRMVRLTDTFDSVKKRMERWKKMDGMTVQQKYLNADFRIVAKVESLETYKIIGFILSYAKDGKMEEKPFTIAQVEKLAKDSRVRNMTQRFQLTYGRIEDLPSHFIHKK